jgi:mycothiol system anti-sigma-R factor
MSCNNYRPFIGAYIDDEFDEREAAEFEAHVDSCEGCRRELEQQAQLKEAIQTSVGDAEAPVELKERIVEGMGEIDVEERMTADSQGSTRPYAAMAAALPLAAGVAVILWFMPSLTVAPVESGQPPVVEQTVDWHRQDLPVEVPGPNSDEVANWFRGKVDFPVRLPNFSEAEGIDLSGGRIAHVQNRRAAYLAYDVNGARMSVMMFHADGIQVPTSRIRQVGEREIALFNNHGFEVAMLQDGGVTYTMTSDLSEKELVEVVDSSVERSGGK